MSAVKHYLPRSPRPPSPFAILLSLSVTHTHRARVFRCQAFTTSVSHAALYLQPGRRKGPGPAALLQALGTTDSLRRSLRLIWFLSCSNVAEDCSSHTTSFLPPAPHAPLSSSPDLSLLLLYSVYQRVLCRLNSGCYCCNVNSLSTAFYHVCGAFFLLPSFTLLLISFLFQASM